MDANELGALQAPIKERYRSDPHAAVVTLKAVATALDIPLKSGRVSAEGDLDFRGTLGVAKDAPVGFANIRLRFDLDTDAPQDKLDQLLKLTERYCVVYQTIKAGPPVAVRLARVSGI